MRPEKIGRYSISRTLGIGGMGTVYLGWDEELQRPVAIKGLAGSDVGPERRERLRREALATAALDHPAIAHVYEIVTEAGQDWLVMEYVEGTLLSDLIVNAPLPPDEVARIGLEVARALASAHRRGIVHRDVKTDNVILTPAGDVRVLDFGLALRAGPDSPDRDRLTGEGMVVGTARSMSPEQALGKPTDARTDIFSLGSMLYELASGQPAFTAPSPMEVMVKVARNERSPLARVAPGLPESLVAVIERCMESDPAGRFPTADAVAEELEAPIAPTGATRAVPPPTGLTRALAPLRRRWWVAAGTALAITALAIIALWRGWLSPAPPLTVAVLPVEIDGDAEALRLASAAVADAIASHLSRLDDLIVVSGREVRASYAPDKSLTALATELGVRELVSASLTAASSTDVHIRLTRTEGATLEALWRQDLEAATTDLLLLEDRITTALEDGYRDHAGPGDRHAGEVSAEALRTFLEVRSRLEDGRASSGYKEEIALLGQTTEESPRFEKAWIRLLAIHRYLGALSEDERHIRRAEEIVERLDQLGTDDPGFIAEKISFLSATKKLQEAARLAQRQTLRRPGDADAWHRLGNILSRLQRYDEAERAFRRAIALRPGSRIYLDLALSKELQGEYGPARAAVDEALRLAPDSIIGKSRLAEVAMYSGDNALAETLYRELLDRRGSRVDLIHLGNAVFYQGRYAEAARLYSQAVDRDPDDYLAVANLADALLWAGEGDASRQLYERAVQACDRKSGFAFDRALLETKARCLAQLGRSGDSLAALQDLLEAHSQEPSSVFTAALVYAILGEETACLAWTRKALDMNVPTVWFSGPEFADMRQHPQFASLTQR